MIWDNCDGVDLNDNQLPDQISLCKDIIYPSNLCFLQNNNSYGAYIPGFPLL